MTSMEQIERISGLARAEGLTYGEYVKKYPKCMEKPEPTKRREVEYYAGIGKKKYTPRKKKELVCETCGGTFMSSTATARWCPVCRAERSRLQTKEACRRIRERHRAEKQKRGQNEKVQE